MTETLVTPMTLPPVELPSPVRRSWAKRTALLGLLVFVAGFIMHILPSGTQASALCGHRPNLSAFELARSVADVQAVFNGDTPGCSDAMRRAMDHLNRINLPFFMLLYAAFMVSAALFESASAKKRRWLWALLAVAVALLGDLLETGILRQINSDISTADVYIVPLMITAWMKWLALGSYAAIVAVLTLARAPRRWIVGAINCAAALLTLVALFSPHEFGSVMRMAIGWGWIALWIDSLRAVFVKR
jgi:hypothetical protein